MNLHVPQSVEAATELREIAAVPKQMISPKLSKPLISVVQDTLVGVNRLTRPTEFFTRREFMNLLIHSKRWDGRMPPPAKTEPVPLWSGQQVVSSLLPAVYLAMGNKMWDEAKGRSDPNYVIINNGEIQQGVLDGDVFDKSLIHILYNDFSPEMTVDFLDSLQAIVATYLQNSGFSVGLSDIVADADTLSTIASGMSEVKKKIESLQLQVHMGLFDNTSGRTNQEEFEGKVFQTLDKARDDAGKTGLRSLVANNRMVNMVKCGSKGSDTNIAQMIALLGQQAIEGKRIAYGFQDRTLPHFKRHDDGADARGFIESSFVKGLTPSEFFFHAMTGREGLIDTAVKSVTAETPIIIQEGNGTMRRVRIGEWIDTHMSSKASAIEHHTDRNLEMLHLEQPVYIPTTDGAGNVSWGAVTAVTRHDPGTKLYKITTAGGRSVTVSEAQSLLIYNEKTAAFERLASPEVRVGHHVPTTASLAVPPTTATGIALDRYLPGNTDVFAFTEENGLFLGLFLAEGNADIASGYVQITNNDPVIRSAVRDWFTKHSIEFSENVRTNALGGTSSDVRGYSTILARFLTALVGHGASNKHIPAEAFAAPDAFVCGLLNGYFSGDGTVTENSIEAGSASSELIEGVSMLCSRMGIFGKMSVSQLKSNNVGTEVIAPTHRIAIRAQWAARFAECVPLIDAAKQERLSVLRPTKEHRNFRAQNDVVLDAITSIEVTGTELHPKLYDLTVPSTLNFGLANGLHVVDTAESGYMYRQLVKTMEDMITYHDGTVRDAGGLLVQFAYGDDGTNATKIENQPIRLADMTDTEIRTKFTVEDVGADKSQAHLSKVFADRDMLVTNVWGGRVDKTVQSAVHLPRLIANAVKQMNLTAGQGTPVPGAHVLDTIDRILARTRPDNRLWGALLRYHLNPRDLAALGFTRAAFDWLAEQIIVKHLKSWAVPGEMAGIIAAQSIGETTTQMSSHKETWISAKNLQNTSEIFVGKVGVFIDKIMTENNAFVMRHGDSEALNLPENTWAIMGVNDDEKTSWKPISQVSRHPANGGLVKVTTKSGRTTTATLSHSFLRRTTCGLEEIKGSDLRVGHRIPVAYRMPESPDALKEFNGFALTREFGWLFGIYLADGSFSGNTVRITKIHPIVEERIRALAATYGWEISVRNYAGQFGPGKDTNIHSAELKRALMELGNTGSFKKTLSAAVFHANREFIAGLLSGYFDGDGNVNSSRQQIRAGSRSSDLIRDMARLLAVVGVFATIKEERSIRMPDAVMYTLNVIRKHAEQFQNAVGFCLPEKAAALAEIVAYNKRDGIMSLREDIDMIPELGDVIAETGRLLKMPGQSRLYGCYDSRRPNPKKAIGRRTLTSYITEFREMMALHVDETLREKIDVNLAILESAANSDVVWDEITELEILSDPHELVYDFTVPGNDSFLVDDNIFVHNTLNSVDWHTEIIIARDGQLWAPKIGEFIDNYIAGCDESRIQRLPNDQLYVALDDGHDWKAVSCGGDGKVVWTKLEAITKHPVINEDGTNTILEVTLESGRSVRATKARSFLRFEDDKLVTCNGSDLRIGDELPILNNLHMDKLGQIDTLSVRKYLSPTEWLYGSDVSKALAVMREADATGVRHWFSAANGKEFTVPYSRSDAFRDAYTKGANAHAAEVLPGFVYPKKIAASLSQIPESIPLDRAFGFFCGAYVAEGSTSDTQIQITNNDNTYLEPIRALLDSWKIGHHTVSEHRDIKSTGITGHTQSLVIHSTLLTAVMRAAFGRISYEKTLPDWIFQAPDEFVAGWMDGYISGDGCVTLAKTVTTSSVSEALITRLGTLLSQYGIFSTVSSYMPLLGKFKSVSRQYELVIPVAYAFRFATLFTLSMPHKQERLNEMIGARRECKWREFSETVLDRVVSIEEVAPHGDRVYDLTVEGTRNFTALNCLGLVDTFHLAGVAAKSGMTRGVPRLKELLNATQNPKATSLTVFLRPDLRKTKEEARRLAQELEFTTLKDLVTVSRIYYDPRDSASLIADDSEWLSFFAAFEADEVAEEDMSPWILRLELDREKMFNKNITMEDINYVLRGAQPDLSVTYTDHNASRMIIRIRINHNSKENPLNDLGAIKARQNKLLTQTLVRGIPGLRSVSFRKMTNELYEKNPDNDNKYEPAEQFVLDTFGTNFVDVMIHPDVDGTKLISNHLHDIYENLGIEAARQILFREVFTLFEQSAPVNYRHVAILCDALTNRGRLMSANRIGVNKKAKIGPLAKASFEQTQDIVLRAALFGDVDPVTGVSANIMTGQPIRGGTSFSHILLDESALKELIASAPPPKRSIERAPALTQLQVEAMLEAPQQAGCRQEDLRIPAALPPMDPTGMVPDELPELEISLVDE